MGLKYFNYFWWDSTAAELFSVGSSGYFFFLKCRVKEEREVKRNDSYSAGQVVEEGDTR